MAKRDEARLELLEDLYEALGDVEDRLDEVSRLYLRGAGPLGRQAKDRCAAFHKRLAKLQTKLWEEIRSAVDNRPRPPE